MTIATSDLPTLLGEAADAIRAQVLAALRPEEFRRLWRKTHTALRANGYENGYQRGAAQALRDAFPEYAAMIPDALQRYGEDTLPPALTEVLRRPVTLTAPPPVPVPDAEDEDQVAECFHDDDVWRCVYCGGMSDDDCPAHRLVCDECGGDRNCPECDLDPECVHLWCCDGCGAREPQRGAW